jgi:hypothetical protein
MDRGRVGEDRGSKEMDGCPLTGIISQIVVRFNPRLFTHTKQEQSHALLIIQTPHKPWNTPRTSIMGR